MEYYSEKFQLFRSFTVVICLISFMFLLDPLALSNGCLVPSFKLDAVYSTGPDSRAIATGDFNNDGKQDVVTASLNLDSLETRINDGSGTFPIMASSAVGMDPVFLVVADLNGDSNLDVISVNNASSNISVLLGDGAGGFGPAVSFPVGAGPLSATVEDFNHDGKKDIAVANEASGTISILLGNGSGGFASASSTFVGQQPRFIASADFNVDGNADLALSMIGSTQILLGNGAGGFTAGCSGPVSDALAIGDLNGDGRSDLASISFLSDTVMVQMGTGPCLGPAVGFQGSSSFGFHVQGVAITDLNSDGKSDLLISTDSAGLSVLLGDGLGSFGTPRRFGNQGTRYIAIADFNNDSKSDVAMLTFPNTLSIIFGDGVGGFTRILPSETSSLTAADFNGDGRADLAATYSLGVEVMLATNNGGWQVPRSFTTAPLPVSVTSGDFNNDSKLDLAVATAGNLGGNMNVSILLGDGVGGFSAPNNFPITSIPWSIAVADINNDGKLDLITANQLFENITVLLGTGGGGFGPATSYPALAATNPQSMAFGDFNRDGKVDLALPSNAGLSILLGNGQGGFGPVRTVGAGTPSQSVAVGDFNNDGRLDAVTSNPNPNSSSITLLLGDGNGGFSNPQTLTVAGISQSVTVNDFNGDGLPDVASANAVLNNGGPSNITILLNDGSGGFSQGISYLIGFNPHAIISADVNGDGSADLLSANGSGVLSLLLNSCASPPFNPIDNSWNFIRQHYLDFLNREPDPGGWDYWTSNITQCGTDVRCIHNHRIDVSAAFFIELEFQETGYVVYRMHRAAFGTWPGGPSRANVSFATFMVDRSQLVAGPGLPQSTITFANALVQRPEFLQAYPVSLSNTQFVNQLFDTAGLTPFTTERQQEIDAMNNVSSPRTRAQVLLDVIEIPTFKTREYNAAFVLMQYFGYLRRDPDQGGYDFWLDVLNNRVPGNFRGMVCAFLTSAEYQQRFGATVTRTDHDCGP